MEIGDFIGPYRLEKRCARGGMGEVWRARHPRLNRSVAIKLIRAEVRDRPHIRAAFMREVESLGRLHAPQTLQVLDFGLAEDGHPYLVTEFLDGEDLRARLSRLGRLSVEEAVWIGIEILKSLSEAHALGIVHRDLKPGNVFLHRLAGVDGAREAVKVLDFGVAKILAAEDEEEELTEWPGVKGSPRYIAPEMVRGDVVTPAADLYSFGALLYRVLTGDAPFGGDREALLVAHLSAKPRSITEHSPLLGVPAALDALVMECLEKRIEARPASAGEVRRRMESLRLGGADAIPAEAAPSDASETRLDLGALPDDERDSAAPHPGASSPAPEESSHMGLGALLVPPAPSRGGLAEVGVGAVARPGGVLAPFESMSELATPGEGSIGLEDVFGRPDASMGSMPMLSAIGGDSSSGSEGLAQIIAAAGEPAPRGEVPGADALGGEGEWFGDKPPGDRGGGAAPPAGGVDASLTLRDAQDTPGAGSEDEVLELERPTRAPALVPREHLLAPRYDRPGQKGGAQLGPTPSLRGPPPSRAAGIAVALLVLGVLGLTWGIRHRVARALGLSPERQIELLAGPMGLRGGVGGDATGTGVPTGVAPSPSSPGRSLAGAPAVQPPPVPRPRDQVVVDAGTTVQVVRVIARPGPAKFTRVDTREVICAEADECELVIDVDHRVEKKGYKVVEISGDDLYDRRGGRMVLPLQPR